MKDRARLLAPAPRVSMHLVVAVSGVIDPNRLHSLVAIEQQNHRVVDDIAALRRELDLQQRLEGVIEKPAVIGAHTCGQ